LSQARDADIGACGADLQRGETERSLDWTAADVDMLDTAERQRFDSVSDYAAAQRQIVFAELIGEPPYFQNSDDGHQQEQQEYGTANQEWRNFPIGLYRKHHGADTSDRGRQCNASQANSQVAGVDGHECFVVEPREVIGRDWFVAEQIGHACFLATA
jgi:hypothetical protein